MEFIEFARKKPIYLQLTPMIDVFTLIIVFLLKGAVLGGVSIVFPSDMESAKSASKEVMEAAPEVLIYKDRVQIPSISQEFPLQFFESPDPDKIKDLSGRIRSYIQSVSAHGKDNAIHANVVADAKVSYRNIFNVVKALRQAGFQSILFIAEGETR